MCVGLELPPKIKQILTLFAHVIWLNRFKTFYLAFVLSALLHVSVHTLPSPPQAPHVLHKFMIVATYLDILREQIIDTLNSLPNFANEQNLCSIDVCATHCFCKFMSILQSQ